MERKLYDFFEGEAMPRIVPRKLKRRCAIAVATLVLVLAMFNAEAIRVKAQEIRGFVVNALSPEATPVGWVEEDVYISFRGSASSGSLARAAYALEKHLNNQEVHFAEVRDGRLYFIANGEDIDITDQCSMDTAFIYVVEDSFGYIHYLCVGGTPEYWGEEEHIYNPALGTEITAWDNGGGYNTWDYNTENSRWPWVYDARNRTGYPFGI